MFDFIKRHKKWFEILSGVLLFCFFNFYNPLGLDVKAKLVLATAALVITWWIVEAMPLPVVALVPLVLFPLFGINTIKEVSKSYADSIIFLFMGGFFIGIAIEKWNLHKRIALSIINITGTNGNKIILGFILSTGLLSMWLSNTATAMMMATIATPVIAVIASHNAKGKGLRNFSMVLMLCIAYASNFGGIATIIGTPPNVAFVNHISEKFNYNIGFVNWMIVFTPLAALLLFTLYIILTKWLFPNDIKDGEDGKIYIKNELKSLGKLSVSEKRILIVFCTTVFLWITKDIINVLQTVIKLDDTMIALIGAISLFIIPSGKDAERLLEWKDTTKMAWGILLLFGGGIAVANALEGAKLMLQLGNYIASFATSNLFVMILLITTISVFLSEIMSNIAQVIVMAPVITAVAVALHIDPLLLGLPMTLGASCASMLPMGTPPNAIVFASGHIKMKDMLGAGLILNIICIIFITLFCWLLLPLVISIP
ncbi:MAG: DASS family sodium-coupled anion symporter [Bacteroidota bacterium]